MSPVRNPFPPQGPFDNLAQAEIYRAQSGRLRADNAARRGFSLGHESVAQGEAAGNLDAAFVTVSFATSSAAVQTVSASHNLGRVPVGVEVVNANGPLHLFTDSTFTSQETDAQFSALVFGGPMTATARIY